MLNDRWRTQQQEINKSADDITGELAKAVNISLPPAGSLSEMVLEMTFEQISATYDAVNGGFGEVPKFARPVVMEYLLRYWWRTGDKTALDMTLNTLRAMARGGIHDQLGGGFHRYSTDVQSEPPRSLRAHIPVAEARS